MSEDPCTFQELAWELEEVAESLLKECSLLADPECHGQTESCANTLEEICRLMAVMEGLRHRLFHSQHGSNRVEIVSKILEGLDTACGGDRYGTSQVAAAIYAHIRGGVYDEDRAMSRIAASQLASRRGWDLERQAQARDKIAKHIEECRHLSQREGGSAY